MSNYKTLLSRLRQAHPEIKVRVRKTRTPKGILADCGQVADGFLIRMSPDMDSTLELLTLVHEFAHCLSWEEFARTGKHGKRWASHYARCYRIYESICEESHQ